MQKFLSKILIKETSMGRVTTKMMVEQGWTQPKKFRLLPHTIPTDKTKAKLLRYIYVLNPVSSTSDNSRFQKTKTGAVPTAAKRIQSISTALLYRLTSSLLKLPFPFVL